MNCQSGTYKAYDNHKYIADSENATHLQLKKYNWQNIGRNKKSK